MIPLNGRVVNLTQLQQELAAAGIHVAALGITDDMLFTYDAEGQPADLPPEAAAVVASHVAHPDPVQAEATAATSDFDSNYQAAVNRLDQIIGATSPTNAQVVAAMQDEARILKRLCRLAYVRLAG